MMATYAGLRRERKTKETAEERDTWYRIEYRGHVRAKFSAVCRIIAGLTVIVAAAEGKGEDGGPH